MHAGSGPSGRVEGAEPRRFGSGRPLLRCVVVIASLMVSSVPVVTVLAPAGAAVRTVHSTRRWHGAVVRPGHVRSARLSALASTTGGVSAAAAQSGETELAGLRTQDSRTFAEADGTRRLVASATPMNYRDASGAWQPIDDTLVADSATGFAWRNTADSYTAEFPADLADGPIRVSVAGQWVAFQLRGAKATGQVSGNTITTPTQSRGSP